MTTLLRVRLGSAVLGLPATAVREIVRAVAIAPLPGAPAIVEGAVNVRGLLVPVIDVRHRLALATKPLDPDEFLIVLNAGARTVAMRVDDVEELIDVDADSMQTPAALSPALRGLSGVAAHDDGVVVIYDPDAFVSQGEVDAIDVALAAGA